jgi:hypothetical protein
MNKFNILYEEVKDITEILKDCEVVYQPGDSENPNKCKSCGKDIEGKMYSFKDGNMCEKCFDLLIKRRKNDENEQ